MIAMALAGEPQMLVADEPTTALDATIQAQILDLIDRLRREMGMALVLISHDLGVIAETAQRVIVMYAGRKVEEAPVGGLFRNPKHPYTRGLIGAIPRLAPSVEPERRRLAEISGMVPTLRDEPRGCSFAPRCSFATDRCRNAYPAIEEAEPHHFVACWNWKSVASAERSP